MNTRLQFPMWLMVGVIGLLAGCKEMMSQPKPSQPPPAAYFPGQPLGIADIKALVWAGISDEVILSQIRNAHVVFHLTTSEILELKTAKVSDKVIDFMINTQNLYRTVPAPPPHY